MKSAPSIAFDLRPSRMVASALLLITLAAVGALTASHLPSSIQAIGSVAVLFYGGWCLRQHLRTDHVRIARGTGGWFVVDRDGNELALILRGHQRLGNLITLQLQTAAFVAPQRRLRYVFAPDNLDAESRRLLVLSLLRGEPSSPR